MPVRTISQEMVAGVSPVGMSMVVVLNWTLNLFDEYEVDVNVPSIVSESLPEVRIRTYDQVTPWLEPSALIRSALAVPTA